MIYVTRNIDGEAEILYNNNKVLNHAECIYVHFVE